MHPESFTPANLDTHPDFEPSHLRDKKLLIVPSQGEHNTKIFVGQEGEMLYEQRQAGEATNHEPGIFVSRAPLPIAEAAYLRHLFGDHNPIWKMPSAITPGVPLDRIVLGDESLLHELGTACAEDGLELYGFNQTEEMAEIADRLEVRYFGNPHFAGWAGTKIGLAEFAAECGVRTPTTVPLFHASELREAAEVLAERGYQHATIKVSHSAGAMGQEVCAVADILSAKKSELATFLPEEFMTSEGAVIQGWIPEGEPVSLHTFVDFDGTYTFTGAQTQLLTPETPPGSAGAVPIDERHLPAVLEVGRRIAEGYVAHHAYGPHAMDMIIPSPDACELLGLKPGEPLCHDENTRSSAAMISRAWALAITEGRLGVGWKDAKVKLPVGTRMADVIATLEREKLLITETGPDAHGVFVYNGAVLDSGHDSSCYVLAISSNDDPWDASELLERAAQDLGGRLPQTRESKTSAL